MGLLGLRKKKPVKSFAGEEGHRKGVMEIPRGPFPMRRGGKGDKIGKKKGTSALQRGWEGGEYEPSSTGGV